MTILGTMQILLIIAKSIFIWNSRRDLVHGICQYPRQFVCIFTVSVCWATLVIVVKTHMPDTLMTDAWTFGVSMATLSLVAGIFCATLFPHTTNVRIHVTGKEQLLVALNDSIRAKFDATADVVYAPPPP